MEDRLESYRRLTADRPPGGEVGQDPYLARTREVALFAVGESLERLKLQPTLFELESEVDTGRYPPEAMHYLGEAYRLRAEPGDDHRSQEAYEAAIARSPSFGPPHRALGYLYLKHGDKARARDELEVYLRLDPAAKDAAYVRRQLEDLAP
jgi:tetratricopeptide (TPR) repeat protein